MTNTAHRNPPVQIRLHQATPRPDTTCASGTQAVTSNFHTSSVQRRDGRPTNPQKLIPPGLNRDPPEHQKAEKAKFHYEVFQVSGSLLLTKSWDVRGKMTHTSHGGNPLGNGIINDDIRKAITEDSVNLNCPTGA